MSFTFQPGKHRRRLLWEDRDTLPGKQKILINLMPKTVPELLVFFHYGQALSPSMVMGKYHVGGVGWRWNVWVFWTIGTPCPPVAAGPLGGSCGFAIASHQIEIAKFGLYSFGLPRFCSSEFPGFGFWSSHLFFLDFAALNSLVLGFRIPSLWVLELPVFGVCSSEFPSFGFQNSQFVGFGIPSFWGVLFPVFGVCSPQ